MRLAYADPPYLGRCSYYGHEHGNGQRPFDGRCWNDLETHRLLVAGRIPLKKGFVGSKTPEFCDWVLSLLNAGPDDWIDDIFVGTDFCR